MANMEGKVLDGERAWERGLPLTPYIQHLFPQNVKEYGFERNCEFQEDDRGNIWVMATKPIWAGEELFTDYGDAYWDGRYPPGMGPWGNSKPVKKAAKKVARKAPKKAAKKTVKPKKTTKKRKRDDDEDDPDFLNHYVFGDSDDFLVSILRS